LGGRQRHLALKSAEVVAACSGRLAASGGHLESGVARRAAEGYAEVRGCRCGEAVPEVIAERDVVARRRGRSVIGRARRAERRGADLHDRRVCAEVVPGASGRLADGQVGCARVALPSADADNHGLVRRHRVVHTRGERGTSRAVIVACEQDAAELGAHIPDLEAGIERRRSAARLKPVCGCRRRRKPEEHVLGECHAAEAAGRVAKVCGRERVVEWIRAHDSYRRIIARVVRGRLRVARRGRDLHHVVVHGATPAGEAREALRQRNYPVRAGDDADAARARTAASGHCADDRARDRVNEGREAGHRRVDAHADRARLRDRQLVPVSVARVGIRPEGTLDRGRKRVHELDPAAVASAVQVGAARLLLLTGEGGERAVDQACCAAGKRLIGADVIPLGLAAEGVLRTDGLAAFGVAAADRAKVGLAAAAALAAASATHRALNDAHRAGTARSRGVVHPDGDEVLDTLGRLERELAGEGGTADAVIVARDNREGIAGGLHRQTRVDATGRVAGGDGEGVRGRRRPLEPHGIVVDVVAELTHVADARVVDAVCPGGVVVRVVA